MEVHYNTGIILFCVNNFFIICFCYDGQEQTFYTQRRFNDIWNILAVFFRVEVFHRLAAVVHVLSQVVIGTVCNAPQFAPTKCKAIFKVGGCLRIEAEFFRIVVTQPQVFFLDAQIQQEVLAVASPILEPFEVGIRFAEKFQFHLFKFPNTEDEVTRCNFVSERFPDLTNAERNFFPSGSLDVCEVYKNTLSRFWTQIQFRLRVFCNALESLKHQVELPNVGEIRLTAVWTRNLLFPDVVHHFFI